MTRVPHVKMKGVAVLAFVVFSLGVFAFLYTLAGGQFTSAPYHITVRLPDAFQLAKHADVRAAGTKVGQVGSVTNVGDTSKVVIDLNNRNFDPVYRNATVQLGEKTLVGENYLKIAQGTRSAGAIPNGGTLPLSRAVPSVEIDQIFSMMDPKTRAAVRADLDGLGPGLDGRGQSISDFLGSLDSTVDSGMTVSQIVDAQRGQLAALIQDTGQVMQALGERTADLRTLVSSARLTALAVASRDRALVGAIDLLPATLTQAQRTTTALATLSQHATPVMADLADATQRVLPAVKVLAPTATATNIMLGDLRRFTPIAEPLLVGLQTFSNATAGALPGIDALLRQLNPAIAFLAPYNREIGAFFASNGSINQPADALGHVARVHAEVDARSLNTFTPAMRTLLEDLSKVGLVSLVQGDIGANPYPAPGTIANPQPFSGDVPGVNAEPAAK
jgi:phospholipid/cholesterol/gamma-HCH transport system substrate-binding protein